MPVLVTSAAGANGDGYGALLAFDDNINGVKQATKRHRN
jgi:hypothetical protein